MVGVGKMVDVRKIVGVDYGWLCKTDYGYGRISFININFGALSKFQTF